jgi:hypothetical protein
MEVTKAESGVAFEGAGFSDVKPCFWISSGAPTRALHVAFAAKTRKAADDLQAAAFAAGAKDNGPPGVRPHYHPNYYGAFVADPDGCVIYLLDGFPYWRNNYIIFNIIIYMKFAALVRLRFAPGQILLVTRIRSCKAACTNCHRSCHPRIVLANV